MDIHQPFSQVAKDVKRHDPVRFLTTLFVPDRVRPAFWALYAFNAELGRIRDAVTEQILGQIRFQWWRDTLGNLEAGVVAKSPVVQDLAPLVHTYNVPVSLLCHIVDARSAEVESLPFETEHALEQYCDGYGGALAEAVCRIGGVHDEVVVSAARQVGQAAVVARTMLRVPASLAAGHCPVPSCVLDALRLDPGQLSDPDAVAKLAPWSLDLCRMGRAILGAARHNAPRPQRDVLAVFLEAMIAERTFSILERNGGNLIDPDLHRPDNRALGMTWRVLRGRW
ncbi:MULTISPECIES: phytoene/squalene synthase family protein [unclassified Haematospirillum]|uniref:phytoene/squalene synthase family protein n=1 Tax=unclassified Haematospirillum TaxID=2622088 RepID=UPI00143C3260|nr:MULTISPECIES: squalene/phytoene synthase family protein [unclassified Haematospirillum]NKD54296.1 squalene/phytoene synthase family protein [Haematospirillum sp. H4890]NKD74340.1 squalene/phytoene synthase family protein [Haematospirillum sp. H4485]NKD86989.1 squalene/phytoene synthase family protein [Haematospirillum sp. 15-248]